MLKRLIMLLPVVLFMGCALKQHEVKPELTVEEIYHIEPPSPYSTCW